MPLSVTKSDWLRETSVPMRSRSAELERLDQAIATGNPFAAKDALLAWIVAGHQNWRTNARNNRGAIKRLYDELGLGRDLGQFVEPLVQATVKCRAGSRVLQVRDDQGRLTPSAQLWVACGFAAIVEVDIVNLTQFYETIGSIRLRVERKQLPATLIKVLESAPGNLQFRSTDFTSWAANAIGSCGEAGSSDAVLWVEHICQKTGLDYNLHRGAIEAAKQTGRTEQESFERANALRRNAAGQIQLPPDSVASASVSDYLRQIVRLNRDVPPVLLAAEYNRQRNRLKEDLLLEDNDEDLIPWEVARRV